MAFETVFLEEQKKCLLEEKARLESELNRFAKPTDTQGDFATQMEDLGEGEDESALEVKIMLIIWAWRQLLRKN